MLTFTSLGMGTLAPHNALNTLQQHGISINVQRDYFHNMLNDSPFIADYNNDSSDPISNTSSDHNITFSSRSNNCNDQELNTDDHQNIKFSEFISFPNKSWDKAFTLSQNSKPPEKLLAAYKDLMKLTDATAVNVKLLPRDISSFKRASDHLRKFIPRVV